MHKLITPLNYLWLYVCCMAVIVVISSCNFSSHESTVKKNPVDSTASDERLITDLGINNRPIEEMSLINGRKSGFQFVKVEAGKFMMGTPGDTLKYRPHEESVSDFYIGKYEVTQADWMSVFHENPSFFKDCDDCPVERVSWDSVQIFLEKVSKKYKKHFRLPSEREWEYAARGGNRSKGFKYSGSDNLDSVGWFFKNNKTGKPNEVGIKAPNELGIYDMTGNVAEWCADASGLYPPVNGRPVYGNCTIKGCNIASSENGCYVYRSFNGPCKSSGSYFGFRIAFSD